MNYVLGIITSFSGSARARTITTAIDTVEITRRRFMKKLSVRRIRGKMKRRMWIRQEDTVLVSPWDFQSDKRGDIIWRYKRNQAEWLRRMGT